MAYSTLADLKEQIQEDDLISLTDDRTNLASTTLAAEATASATTLTLSDSTGFPTAGRIEIDSEQIDYTGNAVNVLSGCTRGANDTTATAHSNGSVVTELNFINTDVTDRAIIDADSKIDAYLLAKYSLPLASTPNLIRKISVDIAIYNLYPRRMGAPDYRRQRYEDAMQYLRDLSRGLVTLGDDSITIDDSAGDDAGPGASTSADDRIFTIGTSTVIGTLDNY